MPFPEILLALRLSNGLSQQQLAERANVAEITIQNYESGRSNPVPTRLLAIADVLFRVVAQKNLRTVNRELEMLMRQHIADYEDKHGEIVLPQNQD